MKPMANPTLWRMALLGLAVSVTYGCGEHEPPAAQNDNVTRTLAADMQTVQQAPLSVRAELPGMVASEDQVQVTSRLMGYIREIKVEEGQVVKAGQLLFVIDPTDIQGQMSQARAGLAQAEAALTDAKIDHERFGTLYQEEAIPKLQWDKIRLQKRVAEQQVAAARAGLNQANSQMRYASVVAPINGVVTQKMANAGDLATPGRPVLVIEGLKKLQVRTQVSSSVFDQIKVGEKVTIVTDGDAAQAPAEGTIAQVVPVADPVSHTHLVKIDLPAGSGLSSGNFVRVGFAVGSRQGIRVPAAALAERAGITGVFVVDAQGFARYRMVRTGVADQGTVEIQSGLNAGEKIIVSNVGQLENGDRISGGTHD
ncbi:MAG: efflux transporter periplasmic adaptor subunit [Hydrogenophilales bacterium RIFOXYD1_FULL_62_11]|nr:MAG: efflux transporter periplasmic adaptor subunit [Hydrogenophilales bacterium RIFOXYD1_FULL_62_11]